MSAENNAGYSDSRTTVSDDMLARYATDLLQHPTLPGDDVEAALSTEETNERIYDALFRLAWDADEREMQALDTRLNQGRIHPALYDRATIEPEAYQTVEDVKEGISFYLILGAHQAIRSLKRVVLMVGNSHYRFLGPRGPSGRHFE